MDENQSILEKINEKTRFLSAYGGASTSHFYQQARNDLDSINRTFNSCRINNPNDYNAGRNTLLWNPETNCFEVRQYYYPKIKEKPGIPNINDPMVRTNSLKSYPKRKQLNLVAVNDKYKRDECFQEILDIKDQVIKSSSTWFKPNPKNNNYADACVFKSKFKRYKAVSFNPEVQVIYMVKKKSNNEVYLKGVEVLNKEQDQQMRNYIMRSEYCKKKLLF